MTKQVDGKVVAEHNSREKGVWIVVHGRFPLQRLRFTQAFMAVFVAGPSRLTSQSTYTT